MESIGSDQEQRFPARSRAALLGLFFGLMLVDGGWAIAGRFAVDVAGCLRLVLLSLCLLAGAAFYTRWRRDPGLAAMLFGTGFLCGFSLEASLLNQLMLTRLGPRIDDALAAWDRAWGFDWPAVMAWMAAHPWLNAVALGVYSSMLPQVALLTIALAVTAPARVYSFCLALALSAIACIVIWTIAPSLGAFSVYPTPPHMALALDSDYASQLVRMLHDGPGLLSPRNARGLIGFPSYHGVLALLVAWHAWPMRRLRWPIAALNALVLAATPIQGGHHLVDVLASFPVAALALLAAAFIASGPGLGMRPTNALRDPAMPVAAAKPASRARRRPRLLPANKKPRKSHRVDDARLPIL